MTLFDAGGEWGDEPTCRVDGCTSPPVGTGRHADWCEGHQPRPVDANVAPVGRRHPQHAKDAAARALPRSGSKRRQVYDWLLNGRRYSGATGEEVGVHFGWPHQSYSPIVSGLAADGWIVPLYDEAGERVLRPTVSGSEAQVYVVALQPHEAR